MTGEDETFGALRELLHTHQLVEAARWIGAQTPANTPARFEATQYAAQIAGAGVLANAQDLSALIGPDPDGEVTRRVMYNGHLYALFQILAGWPPGPSLANAWRTLERARPSWADRMGTTRSPLWRVRLDFGPLVQQLRRQVREEFPTADPETVRDMIMDRTDDEAPRRARAFATRCAEADALGGLAAWWLDEGSADMAPVDLVMITSPAMHAQCARTCDEVGMRVVSAKKIEAPTLLTGEPEEIAERVEALATPLDVRGDAGAWGWVVVRW